MIGKYIYMYWPYINHYWTTTLGMLRTIAEWWLLKQFRNIDLVEWDFAGGEEQYVDIVIMCGSKRLSSDDVQWDQSLQRYVALVWLGLHVWRRSVGSIVRPLSSATRFKSNMIQSWWDIHNMMICTISLYP